MFMNKVLVLKGLLATMGLYIAYKLGLELWCIAYGLLM
jgi:hypothetical protein